MAAFESLMYADMCTAFTFTGSSAAQCAALDGGILTTGLYSSITRYLSNLQRANNWFVSRPPSETAAYFINSAEIVDCEQICDVYMRQIHRYLEQYLLQEIEALEEFLYMNARISSILKQISTGSTLK